MHGPGCAEYYCSGGVAARGTATLLAKPPGGEGPQVWQAGQGIRAPPIGRMIFRSINPDIGY